MGEIAADIITVIVGILFYTLSIISIIAIVYSYLKQWKATRRAIENIEVTAANPILIIILKVLEYAKYLAIPIIIWGLYWYTMYAQVTV